ncbi:MAG: phosphate ABC transporter permease PstA [Armatimonadaceae bacterium]
MTLLAPDRRSRWRRALDRTAFATFGLMAWIAVGALGWVLFFLIRNGIPALRWTLFTRAPDNLDPAQGGVLQSLLGTCGILIVASVLALPLGILGGIYQWEGRGRLQPVVRFLTDVLSGVPSIVIGIFVYAALVYPVSQRFPGKGYSGYAGGVALAVLMLPVVMRTTEEMLRLVPSTLAEAALGLGASRWRTVFQVVLPAARGGVTTGVMLAIARVAGETAPLLFTVLGNEFLMVHRWNGVPLLTMNGPVDALPLRLYRYATNADPVQNQIAWATALVLIGMVLVMSIAARVASRGRVSEES